PQNPLCQLQSRLLPRGSLPRPSALAIPVPYLRLPCIQATSTLTGYRTSSGSAGASVAWHSAESSCRNSISMAPDLHAAVASLACHGTGLPTTTDAWRDSDTTLLPAGATSLQSDSLYATARKNGTGVPGAGAVCGKALSTSTLVNAPATPPALGTRVRAGERENDAVKQRAQPAAISVLWHGGRARVPAHACTLTQSHQEC
ncbi:hypothetical protein B0H14DRAFT_3669541, partial [Mycena olivaceomarginata]